MNYSKTVTKSNEYRENNDCSVKAVSITCDVSYTVAHKALKAQGRASRQGVTIYMIRDAVKSLGYEMKIIPHSARTMSTIHRERSTQKGYYMALVRGHVASIVNGKVEDWTEGRRHKVTTLFKVTPKATRKERKAIIKQILGA